VILDVCIQRPGSDLCGLCVDRSIMGLSEPTSFLLASCFPVQITLQAFWIDKQLHM
jgi:hypothetical protein